MLVNKKNIKEAFEIFNSSLNITELISFDCEMSGVTYDITTDGTKYDTHELRYLKYKKIVKNFDLLQMGITLYIKATKENNTDILNNNIYLERTFTFHLFKNSKLKFLSDLYSKNNKEFNLFNNLIKCHPASLKFLNENNFDFNNLILNGINYNKLYFKEKISKMLNIHFNEGKLPNHILYLSKENQELVIKTIIEIGKFLILKNEKNEEKNFNNKKTNKVKKINNLNKNIINYIVSINLSKIFLINGFNIFKDKTDDSNSTLIIEKSKENLKLDNFISKYNSFDNFESKFNYEKIIKEKYSMFILEKENKDELIIEELGFALFINLIIEKNIIKKIPFVGHNIYLDLMFIYDKLIDDLPESFYEYKTKINKLFPMIYDTKYLVMRLAKEFDNTKLDSLYKSFVKAKFNNYVEIIPDILNGFAYYNEIDNKNHSYHDAGFDSIITGRCFVFLMKAIENFFEVENKKGLNHFVGNNELKFVKSVNINYGFIDFSMRNNLIAQYVNKSVISLLEYPYYEYLFEESYEDYIKNEELLLKKYENCYLLILKKEIIENDLITIYEFADLFENSYYNFSIVKIDDKLALIEFVSNNDEINKNYIEKVIENVELKYPDKIEDIIDYKTFNENSKKILNLTI